MHRIHAPAKLNLYLHITGRRADGFHLLDSAAVFLDMGDTLSVHEADMLTLEVTGPFAYQLAGENLVLKAARAMQAEYGVASGAQIVLEKRIPIGAGLGGGSSDAAAALLALAELWETGAPPDTLARSLGSDVPACMRTLPVRMLGAGDELVPYRLEGDAHLVLTHPRAPLLTTEVYKTYAASGMAFSEHVEWPPVIRAAELPALLAGLRNDLQEAACRLSPVIATMLHDLSQMPGVVLSRMTGSGAACFGLCRNAEEAARAAAELSARHPGWWIAAAQVKGE